MMRKAMKWMLGMMAAVMLLAAICAFPTLRRGYLMYREAAEQQSLQERISEIRSRPGYLTLNQVPEAYQEALLKSEDRRFYLHAGIDPIALLRAAFHDLLAGAYIEGGSTIDQQLTKNLFFTFSKTMDRKAAELFAVQELESACSKQEILELYINITYFGNGCYGLQAASEHYYHVEPAALTGPQIAILVQTIKAPSCYNPDQLRASRHAGSLSLLPEPAF